MSCVSHSFWNSFAWLFSGLGSVWLLLPLRIRREDHAGDHHSDGLDVLHESGVGDAAAIVRDPVDRDLLLLHHDHGGKLSGGYSSVITHFSSLGRGHNNKLNTYCRFRFVPF